MEKQICENLREYVGIKYCIKRDETCFTERNNGREIIYKEVILPYGKRDYILRCDGEKK